MAGSGAMAGSSDRVVPAVGGVLAVPGLAVGSVERFQPESAQAEITQLRKMQDWLAFLTWVELQLKTTACQALAVTLRQHASPRKPQAQQSHWLLLEWTPF